MSTNTTESPITVTVDYDPRGVSVGVWQGSHCIYSGAHPLPAAPGAPTAGNQQPARDWELTCHECDGSGHVYVKHQVAERKTDMQEFKEECECCEGRGFVFAFQDIPGIEEYVKACRTAPAAGDAQTAAARDVLAERQRQISVEGWEPERDDTYRHGELASAAASYAHCAGLQGEGATTENAFKAPFVENWPWSEAWWKPSAEPRRNLVKAGALVLAEIERLDRAAIAAQQGKGGAA